jgi:hypothetical protein
MMRMQKKVLLLICSAEMPGEDHFDGAPHVCRHGAFNCEQ